MTIAEGAQGELFVYVYQPSHATLDLQAVNLSMSTIPTGNENAKWKLYYLTLLDSEGVFDKYQVNNFTVSTDKVRYYDITRISRAYNSVADKPVGGVTPMSDNSQTVETIAYEVGMCWEVKTVDGKVTYHPTKIDVVEITNAWIGNITYSNGYFGDKVFAKCDAWFFALTASMPIDKLIEVDLVYSYNTYSEYHCPPGLFGGGITTTLLDSGIDIFLSLNDKQTGSNKGGGLWGHIWSWDRIVPVSDFLSVNGKDLSSDCKETLSSDEFEGGWVLRFLETDYEAFYSDAGTSTYDYTDITEVSILRLKFKTDGKMYNLGVVSNSYNPDQIPDGDYSTVEGIKAELDDFLKELEAFFGEAFGVLKTIFLVIVFLLLVGGLLLVFSFLTPVFKVLWKIIIYPFVLIGNCFKKKK